MRTELSWSANSDDRPHRLRLKTSRRGGVDFAMEKTIKEFALRRWLGWQPTYL